MPGPDSRTLKMIIPGLMGFLLASLVISPVFASVPAEITTIPESKDTLAQDNPELITALKTHVAYVGQSQDARMDGVIAYIDTISDGTGSENLREIQDDYLAVASSIPVMQNYGDIADARIELQRQSRLFAEETKAQMIAFNGSTDAMREMASESMQSVEDSITSMRESLWLAKDTARLTIFNQESQNRETILRIMSKQGVDVSIAQNISQQIDARRTDLQNALNAKSVPSLKNTNSGLKLLNREFRATVDGYRTNLQIEMKRAAILAMK
jgi:hypothetical protein